MHQEEQTLSAAPKKDLVKTAKDFLGNAFGGKNADLNTVIEEFTAEMTLVAEGLGEDQRLLRQQTDMLCAQQTTFEDETLRKFHDVSVDVQELSQRMDVLEQKLQKLQKLQEKAQEKAQEKKLKRSQGLQGIFRQATVLVAIAAGAWVLTTLINFFK